MDRLPWIRRDWHDNHEEFEEAKRPYFESCFDESPFLKADFLYHQPCEVTDEQYAKKKFDCDPEFVMPSFRISLRLAKTMCDDHPLALRKMLKKAYKDRNLFDGFVLGKNVYMHSLLKGDVIVVHPKSGHALMPDNKRWTRDESPETDPFICVFLGREIIRDYEGDELCTFHACDMDGSKRIEFYPIDIVRNVRSRRQNRAVHLIQNAFRRSMADPAFTLCRKRLKREFEEMREETYLPVYTCVN